MSVPDLLPAGLLGSSVIAALAMAQLMPVGEASVLVRIRGGGALQAAVAAGAALVAVPGDGVAVLHGDAGRIRAALGLAVRWPGGPSCAARVP